MLFTSLENCFGLTKEMVGGKAFHLGQLITNGLTVPKGYCLTTQLFETYKSQTGLDKLIESKVNEIKANPVTINKQLAEIRDFIMTKDLPNSLYKDIAALVETLLHTGPLAIRSSSPSEDNIVNSYAGVYYSTVGVSDMDGAFKSIKKCWASLFTERAFFYNQGKVSTEMAVILQKYIDPDFSGILFSKNPVSHDPIPVLEYKSGNNVGITDGNESGRFVKIEDIKEEFGDEFVTKVTQMTNQLVDIFHSDVDVEWAQKGDVFYILQARAVTTNYSHPKFLWAVQEDLDTLFNVNLGHCHHLLARRLQKHVWFRKFCHEHNIPTYKTYYLVFSEDEIDYACEHVKRDMDMPFLRLTWKKGVGQLCKREDIKEALRYGVENKYNPLGNGFHCVQIGDVIPAPVTGFSRVLENGDILIETFPTGLFGMKDGRIPPTKYVLNSNGECVFSHIEEFHQKGVLSEKTGSWESYPCEPFTITLSNDELDKLADITKTLHQLGEVNVEWYSYQGKIYIKDLSIENSSIVGQSGHQLCLSKGSALGHAVIVKDISILDEFSASNQISVVNYDLDTKELPFLEQYKEIKDKLEKYKDAILIAEYPSVGLIPLIPFVKGMVFTRGTVLCHTAIVLREKHIPSTIWPEVFEKVEEGDRLLINDNQVQLLSKSKQSV